MLYLKALQRLIQIFGHRNDRTKESMRQVFLQKGKIHIQDVNPPLISDHQLLVRVHYSFISPGTESATIKASGKSFFVKYINNVTASTSKIIGAVKEHGISGTLALSQEKLNQSFHLGYSCAGQVIAVGAKVEKFRIGDYVACAGASFALHADVVSVPQNLVVKVKQPSALKYASLTTIGAIALQGVRRAQLQLGETVCIIGLGLIGQITLQLAKRAGCNIIAIDIQDDRLALAKKLGANMCLNPLSVDVIREIEFATGHHGVDATIITAASDSGVIIQQAMLATRRKGRVILVGDVKLDFDRDPFYAKEIDFLISCSYGPGRYDQSYELESVDYPYAYVRWTENRNMSYFVELLEQGHLNLAPLVSKEFDIKNAHAAYDSLKKECALGVILSYLTPHAGLENNFNEFIKPQQGNDASQVHDQVVKPYVHHQGIVNTSLIGVGGFAKVKLLPLLAKIKNVNIHSIIDTDTANAITIARVYKAQRVGNDYHKVVGDDDVKAAIIATPHAFHAEQALQCLAMGKAVLVEKPAAVSFEQLRALKSFFAQHKQSLFCVDFNRSCSPFMKKIKEAVVQRTNPMLITYRMNANYLPRGHWIQNEDNRGRIIGEACHIFELFSFLTDANPVSVMVNTLNATTDDLLITDNIIVTIAMSDGSVCSLIYSSVGNHGVGKEYMELFFDGKTITMNDYFELKGHGLHKNFDRKVKTQDKGHDELFAQFFKAAKSKHEPSPIPLDRILIATEVSLIVDKLARAGGGFEYLTF